MSKFDLQTQTATVVTDHSLPADPCPARRLILLVPIDSDYTAATHRIWELANATSTRIQLLGLCKDTAQEPTLRRGLVTMASLLQDSRISAEVKVEVGMNWMDIVKRNYQTGDLIVCFAEPRTGLLQRPWSQILESSFNAPLYILSDPSAQKPKSNVLSQVIAWSGCIGIIIGFSILQAKVVELPEGWFQNTLLILSLLPELWLIWVWNSLSN